MEYFLMILTGVIVLPFIASAFFISYRYVLGERSRSKRSAIIGDLVWNEIVYEGNFRPMDGPSDRINASDLTGIVGLNESIRASGLLKKDRGVISYVWSRSEDGSIRLYVGVSEAHYGNGSQLNLMASSIGASVVKMNEPPVIPTEDIAIAYRGKSQPLGAANDVREGGAVAKAISSVLERADRNIAASMIITTEYMPESEKRQLSGFITADNLASGGDAMAFGGLGAQTQRMSNQPVRSTIVSSSSLPAAKGKSLAFTMLGSAVNSISSSGWQYIVKPFNASSVGRTGLYLAVVAGALALTLTVLQVAQWFIGIPLALISGVLGWFAVSKANKESLDAVKERLSWGEFNVPHYVFWLWNPRWFIESRVLRFRYGGNGIGVNEAAPSTKRVNYLNPLSIFESISFPPAYSRSGGDVYSNTVISRGIPNALLPANHPIFYGLSGTNQLISLDIDDIVYSMYTAGAPNSGKTNFLQVIYAGVVKACLDKVNGLQITPIWGETKGEGAYDAWKIASRHQRALFVEAHNPHNPNRLSLEGRRISEGASVEEIKSNIDVLVSGMQFAYGDGIRAASREILFNSLLISMLLSENDIVYLGMENYIHPSKPNIIECSRILLGGESSLDVGPKILELKEEMSLRQMGEREQALSAAIGNLSRFFDPALRRQSQSGSVLGPALNKISQLNEAKVMWTPDERPTVAVQDFPFRFAPIVLNMGPYRLPDGNYDQRVGASAASKLLLITNYILWNTIKARCSGWQQQGKRIPMFFDEVADVAIDSDNQDVANVIAEAGKEGRSRGASYFLGSQSPSQLPYQARGTALGSRTKFWFNLHRADDLKVAISEISAASDEQDIYKTNDIQNLPNGVAVGVMQKNGRPTPPFTLKVPWAPKWAEFLLRPGITVSQAVDDYYEWEDRQKDA